MNKNLKIIVPASIGVLALACIGAFTFYGHASANTAASKAKSANNTQPLLEYTLPGGASSLNETYQDWRVVCQKNNQTAQCLVVQQENENKTHQHILTLELQPRGDRIAGFATLPFGLALAKGATLHADAHPIADVQAFTTCVPAGCLVPVNLTTQQFIELQKGTKVEIRAVSVTGQNVSIPFSNKGLEQAMARITALSSSKISGH